MRTNIKNMLLLIMAIKQYVLIISLVRLLGLYLGKDVVYSFINSMIKESKYCNDLMEKKKLVMDKEDDENFKKSIKCWISDNVYLEDDVKVRDYCHDDIMVRDCIVISLENIDALFIEIVISTLN